MSDKVKPMRGVHADLATISGFPYLVSPKIDGIRALVKDGVVWSKTMKPIPNMQVQSMFGHLHGFDGELVVGHAHSDGGGDDVYARSRGPVMAKHTEADFMFCVFDRWDMMEYTAKHRIGCVNTLLGDLKNEVKRAGVDIVRHYEAHCVDDIRTFAAMFLETGFEGVMLRRHDTRYKYGTGTLKAGCLLKVKPMADSEAYILEVEEQCTNTNTPVVNDIGLIVRPSHKNGKVGNGTFGAFRVRDCYSGAEFSVGNGPGLTKQMRAELWADRGALPGKIIRYTYQAIGTIDKPRLPQFNGFRDTIDMSDLENLDDK